MNKRFLILRVKFVVMSITLFNEEVVVSMATVSDILNIHSLKKNAVSVK